MFEYKTLPFNLSLLPYLLNVPIMILSAWLMEIWLFNNTVF
jgi:hypothetical protein